MKYGNTNKDCSPWKRRTLPPLRGGKTLGRLLEDVSGIKTRTVAGEGRMYKTNAYI